MIVHVCNSSTRRLRQLDLQFEGGLGYMVKPCLKRERKQRWGMVMQGYIPALRLRQEDSQCEASVVYIHT